MLIPNKKELLTRLVNSNIIILNFSQSNLLKFNLFYLPFPPLFISWSSLMPTFSISAEKRWSTTRPKDKDGGLPFHSLVRHWINSVWGHNFISSIRSSESKYEKLCFNILIWHINSRWGPATLYTHQTTILFSSPSKALNKLNSSIPNLKKNYSQPNKKKNKRKLPKQSPRKKIIKKLSWNKYGIIKRIRLAMKKPEI